MKIFYSDTFQLPLPEKHRFPMSKYRRLRERISNSTECSSAELLVPAGATDQQLSLIHEPEYVHRVCKGHLTDLEIRRIGFPWSPDLMERSRRSVGASIEAGRCALSDSVSVNLAGGTHHAFPDAGQGYCVFNDTAVAARVLQNEHRVQNVLFIDLDVHQGNGTAAITRDDSSLFSFSIHCEKNFPFRKNDGDLDISLPSETGDADFLNALLDGLVQIERSFKADLAFFLAGADPYKGDRLGHFCLSKDGLKQRDEIVFDFCRRKNLPVAVAMAGGYAEEVEDIVDIHFATVQRSLCHYDGFNGRR